MPLLTDDGVLDDLHARALAVTGWPILGARQLLYMVHAGWRWQVTNPYGQGHIQPITDDEARWAIEARYREWLEGIIQQVNERYGADLFEKLFYSVWVDDDCDGNATTRIDALAKCVLAVAEKVK